jgi:hypothetical protein
LKKKTRNPVGNSNTERAGVHAVAWLFEEKLKWHFREQPVSDFGIDAQVEIKDRGEPTGKLIALQIKSGVSYFSRKTKKGYTFRGELRHLDYWTKHCLPVFLVLHNPETNVTLWQKIERRLCSVAKNSWSINVPEENLLDQSAQQYLSNGIANDDESRRRFAFSVDLDMMGRFANNDVTMTWERWSNKGLKLRNAQFIFPDGTIETAGGWYATGDFSLFMERLYPWLGYRYESAEWDVQGEADIFTLSLSLKPAAQAFRIAEQFFREGDLEPPPEPPIQEDDEDDQDSWHPKWYENDDE